MRAIKAGAGQSSIAERVKQVRGPLTQPAPRCAQRARKRKRPGPRGPARGCARLQAVRAPDWTASVLTSPTLMCIY